MQCTFVIPKSSLDSSMSKPRPEDLVISIWSLVVPLARTTLDTCLSRVRCVPKDDTYTSNDDRICGRAATTSGQAAGRMQREQSEI